MKTARVIIITVLRTVTCATGLDWSEFDIYRGYIHVLPLLLRAPPLPLPVVVVVVVKVEVAVVVVVVAAILNVIIW